MVNRMEEVEVYDDIIFNASTSILRNQKNLKVVRLSLIDSILLLFHIFKDEMIDHRMALVEN